MYALCTLVLVACFNLISGAKFRCDYEYHQNAKGWMKLHHDEAPFKYAMDVCKLEGGAALVTEDNLEARNVTVELMKKNNTEKVWLADSPQSKGKLLTKSDNVKQNQNETATYPFICYYKGEKEVTLNTCGTTDPDYTMAADSGNQICHKYHSNPRKWIEAVNACERERGNLVVVNNQQDAKRLTATKKITDKIFAGFSCNAQKKCDSVNDIKLDKEAMILFAAGSPDPTGTKTCGALDKDNKLHTTDCSNPLPFFCEKNSTQSCDTSNVNSITSPTTATISSSPIISTINNTTPTIAAPTTTPTVATTEATCSSDRVHFAQALIITCSFYLLFK